MLESLRVRNLAIVEDIHVTFDAGLTVITGETGAGKSIIVGALGLVLGERADRTMIRAGEDKCTVEAIFRLDNPGEVNTLLDELGLDPCEDNRLIVRRVIASAGAGKNLVNDCSTTLQAVKRIGNLLVDLHGPHDHQSLLSQDFQLDLLDAFGRLARSRKAYQAIYAERLDFQSRRNALEGSDQDVARQVDMLAYQVKEIEEADLQPDEEETIRSEHNLAANAQRVLELADTIRSALMEDDAAAYNGLVAAQQALGELSRIVDNAAEWQKDAESITVQIQELTDSVARHVEDLETDPGRLQWLDDRLALIAKLKRKYGASIPEVLAFLEQARTELTDLESRGERLAELDALISEATARLTEAGKALHAERSDAAVSLAQAITTELHELGFAHGAFDVGLTETEPGPAGMDEIEFGFAPNVGEPMRPLRMIASSGEISRVMLAVKAVLARHDRIPVLVFDEVDTNVGGEMGNAIGRKLEAVAKTHQVLCITHLPQVAAHGASHFMVDKEISDGRTRTSIEQIADDKRTEEIARMLGGRDLTTVTLEHARELLRRG